MSISPPVSARLAGFAQEMRRWPTPEEKEIWRRLWARRQLHPDFRWCSQAVLYGRIADFWCPAARLIVELDGRKHDPIKDAERDQDFARLEIETIRFRNAEVQQDPGMVFQQIVDAWNDRIKARRTQASPEPQVLADAVAKPIQEGRADGVHAGDGDSAPTREIEYLAGRLAEVREGMWGLSFDRLMRREAHVAVLERLLSEAALGPAEAGALRMLAESIPPQQRHMAPFRDSALKEVIQELRSLRQGLRVRTVHVAFSDVHPPTELWEPKGDGIERCTVCGALLEGLARGCCLLCRRRS